MGREARDLIVDQEFCDQCGGSPVVAYAAQRNHFFWGCENYNSLGCKGTKKWQRIQVPQTLRVLPLLHDAVNKNLTSSKKRDLETCNTANALLGDNHINPKKVKDED